MGYIKRLDVSHFGTTHQIAYWEIVGWRVNTIIGRIKIDVGVYDTVNTDKITYEPIRVLTYSYKLSEFPGCINEEKIYNLLSQHNDFRNDEYIAPDEVIVLGCMNPDSSNFNPAANYDDGSCCKCKEEEPEVVDCAGVPNGDAYYDNCDQCVGGDTGLEPCREDCAGDWGGDAEEDECGVCNGPGIPEEDCDCEGNREDCSGECGGTAKLDECGNCYGGTTGNDTTKLDECGRCPEHDEYGTPCEPPEEEGANTIGLKMMEDGDIRIIISTDPKTEIGGFQFNILNFLIRGTDSEIGLAADAGFNISNSKDMVLGFSFVGATIPPTSKTDILTIIHGERQGDSSPTLTNVLISDISGNNIPFNIISYDKNNSNNDTDS